MSTETNKAIVRRFFEEVFNQNRLEVIHEIFADHFGGHGSASHAPLQGHSLVAHTVHHYRRAFPDIHFTIEEMIAEGDRVVVRITYTGTHQGEFLGVPATQRKVIVTGVEEARIEDGKIVEESWHFFDEIGLLRQLGVFHLASE